MLGKDTNEVIKEGGEYELMLSSSSDIDHLDGVMYVDKAEGPLMETETEED